MSRASHLAGSVHVKRERKKQEVENRRSALAEKASGIDGPNMWDCHICKRTILVAGKDSHLAGRKHRNMELLWGKGKSPIGPGRTDGNPRKNPTDTKPISPAVGEGCLGEAIQKIKKKKGPAGPHGPDTWYCVDCERTMSLMGKGSHLAGKKHRSVQLLREKKESTVEAGPSGGNLGGTLADAKAITPIVGKSGPRDKIPEQKKETENPPPITQWNCEVCERTMPLGAKASHLAGKKHRCKLLQETKEVSTMEAGPAGGGHLVEDTLPDPQTISPTVGEIRFREATDEKQKQTESPQPIKPGPHGKDTWDCEICSRTMPPESKDSHLAGSKHRAMEQQQPPQHLEKQTSHNEEPGSRKDHPRDRRIYASAASTIIFDHDIAAATSNATEDGHSEWYDTVQETPQKVEQPSVFGTREFTS